MKDKVLAAIEQKVAGQELTFAAKDEPKAQVIDLMAALKASLGEDAAEPAEKTGSAASRKRTPAAKSTSAGASSAAASKRKPAKKASSATPAKKRSNAKK